MTNMNTDTIGVDISKAILDVYRLSDNATAQFENSARGFKAFIKWAMSDCVVRIVYEATGPYHNAFERACAETLPLVKVNPLQARRFAQARGTRVKTDAVDAQILAFMGEAFSLQPDRALSKTHHDLKELHTARIGLQKDKTRLSSRLEGLTVPLIRNQIKKRLALVAKHIVEINAAIESLLQSKSETARELQILKSIPGIGAISASAILIAMPEIGTLTRKQAASLAGVAPVTRQSGQWQGKSFIQGGRSVLRKALYMPALVAARYNPDLKAKYDAMLKQGKPPKIALVALMRKIIETANALIKADRLWVNKSA